MFCSELHENIINHKIIDQRDPNYHAKFKKKTKSKLKDENPIAGKYYCLNVFDAKLLKKTNIFLGTLILPNYPRADEYYM